MKFIKSRYQAVFIIICFFLLSLAMYFRMGPELADDGAFFMRYAENMAAGKFWIWNPGEGPIWGASAPLFPIVLAIPIFLGISSVKTAVFVSMFLSIISFTLTCLLLLKRFGSISAVAFIFFACCDSGLMYFSGAVLETPLTLLFLFLGLWVILEEKSWIFVGAIAGILIVHKLDLVPAGAFLILAYWLQTKKFPIKAASLAFSIAIGWYGFAFFYFGAPFPNSFLTKAIHQNEMSHSIDWRWFGTYVLVRGLHKFILLLAFVPIFFKRKEESWVVFLVGIIAVHLVAYTIKYPFEPYNWYCMPSVYCLVVLASVGLHNLYDLGLKYVSGNKIICTFLAGSILIAIFAFGFREEVRETNATIEFVSDQEFDRSEAGRWVSENTPESYTVYTMWGNPALYSRRKVLDGSFLNRKYEKGDLISKYNPEILVLQSESGANPMNPEFPSLDGRHYKVVKIFDKTASHGKDYFFVVLAREDMMGNLKDVARPINLMNFVEDVKVGDKFGIFKVNDQKTFFIHPGETPTSFSFNINKYESAFRKGHLTIEGKIANIPHDAILRGGGVVKVNISADNRSIAEQIVDPTHSLKLEIEPEKLQKISFSIDENGSADSDWFLLSLY